MYKILKNIIEMDDYSVQKLSKSQPPEPFEWNTVEGTELNVDNCIGGKGKITVKGNTEQASRVLPEGYTQVDYIESHGQEYIDTGVNADSNLRTVLDIQYTDISSVNYSNIGAIYTQSGVYTRYHLIVREANIALYLNRSYPLIDSDTNRHFFDIDVINHNVKVDGKEISLENVSTFDTQLNFWLFGRNSNLATLIFMSSLKLFSSKMYVSGVLVRDFIPCYRNSDNEVGLYDIVNNVFYTNQGTGAFTYGAVVNIPNPDYPQEIKLVTGNNNIIQCGKNVIPTNISEWEQGTINSSTGKTESSTSRIRTADFVKVKAMTDYYISTNNDNTYVILNILVYDKNKDFLANYYNIDRKISGTTGLKVAFPEGTEYIKVTVRKSDNSNLVPAEVEIAKPMLEQNTTATEFEPHIEKKYQLNLGNIELCKIGDYQDIPFKNVADDENYNAELEEGVWYKKKVIEKIQITKDTTIVPEIDTALAKTNRFLFRNLQPTVNQMRGSEISNFFKYSSNWSQDVVGFYLGDVNRNFVMRLPKSLPATWDELKTYLSDTPIVVYYILPNPTYSQITDTTLISQLEALRKAKWFKGVNHWWTETENLEPNLKGTYRQAINE